MKKSLLALAVLGAFSSTAFAQSNVTIYGVIDTAIRHITNVPTGDTTGSQTAMTEGAFQGPRIGFKGEEDLGGGNAAVFKLENGFQSNNGAFDQQGQLFGRQEYVGLKGKSWGELDAGRQYNTFQDVLGSYDPLGIGNLDETEWNVSVWGNRFDNSLKYTGSFGPVTVELQYSLGGTAGSTSAGSTFGAGVMYAQGPFSIGGAYQETDDAASNKLSEFGLGGSFVAGPATLYLSYTDTKRDAGFGGVPNASLITNAGNALDRKDDIVTAGVLFQAAPAVELTLGYMSDRVKDEDSQGDSGRISVGYFVADYHLSKRTDVYFDIDYTKLSGAEIGVSSDDTKVANTVSGDFPGGLGGADSRTGIAFGFRTKF